MQMAELTAFLSHSMTHLCSSVSGAILSALNANSLLHRDCVEFLHCVQNYLT